MIVKYLFRLFQLSLIWLLASCSSKYILDSSQTYVCQTDEYTGYLIPERHDNYASLYIDAGNEALAYSHLVTLEKCRGDIYVSGKDLRRQKCTLTPYSNPAQRSCRKGIDYCSKVFDIKTTKDVAYASADGYWTSYPDTDESYIDIYRRRADRLINRTRQTLTMDIYEPKDGSDHRRPLLVMIHGGAFINGDKADEEYRLWCQEFAACGYTAISVNYRMGFIPMQFAVERAAYRAVQDVNAALRYMLSHQEQYHVDPDRIYLAGCSAGAITALNVAFMTNGNRPSSTKKLLIDGDLGAIDAIKVSPAYTKPIRIRSIGNMWGAMFDLNMLKTSSTSIISFHGKNDPVVPYGEGVPFRESVGTMIGKERLIFGNFWEYLGQEAVTFALPKVYGSECIDSKMQQLGRKSELHTYPANRHTLVRNEGSRKLNELHESFFTSMTGFFQQDMIENPVELRASKSMVYIANPKDVAECTWSVDYGVITEKVSDYSVKVLMFADPPHKNAVRKVTVSGTYKSGIPFSQTYVFSQWNRFGH